MAYIKTRFDPQLGVLVLSLEVEAGIPPETILKALRPKLEELNKMQNTLHQGVEIPQPDWFIEPGQVHEIWSNGPKRVIVSEVHCDVDAEMYKGVLDDN